LRKRVDFSQYRHIIVIHGAFTTPGNGYGMICYCADPDAPYFSHATWRLDRNNRNAFIDKENHIAIIPLWSDKGNQGVLITTPEKISHALKAALMIQKLFQRFPEPRGEEEGKAIEACIVSFKRSDFRKCCEIAQDALKRKR
jgi:hypothetical protein